MTAELMRFPGGGDSTSGTGGPEEPMLEQQVARLEEDVRDVKSVLRAIEARLGAIQVSIAAINGRMAGIEGRLQALPTTWQTVAILATLLFGVAAIVFTTGNYLKP